VLPSSQRHVAKFKLNFKLELLGCASHISSTQYPHVVNDYPERLEYFIAAESSTENTALEGQTNHRFQSKGEFENLH